MWSENPAHRSAIARLLQPVTVEEFAEKHYERGCVHVSRNIPGFYGEVFSLAELERVIYGVPIAAADVRLCKDGAHVRSESFRKQDTIDADRVSALFARGCSVVFEAMQRYCEPLATLCREMETFFRHRVNANIYLTPAKCQGFAVHYDTHDTCILQIEGTKEWRLYGTPLELPLDSQLWKKEPLGEPVRTILLEPGDFLYVPRGELHECSATDDYSLHATVGLHPVLWVDAVREALRSAAENDTALRRAIRAGATSRELVLQAVERAFTAEALDAAAARLERAFVTERRNGLRGQLQQIAAIPAANPSTLVSIRPAMLYEMKLAGDACSLSYSGKSLALPAAAAEIIRYLENASLAPLGALEAITPQAKQIVRRLVEDGFAVTQAAAAEDLSCEKIA